MTTALTLGILLGLLAVQVIANAFFLKLGARWAGIPDVTLRRAIGTALLLAVAAVVVGLLVAAIPVSESNTVYSRLAVELVPQIVVAGLVVAWRFKARFLRALMAWAPTLIPGAILAAFAFLVLRPYILETFHSPANSMAPTIVGPHLETSCPQCGGTAYLSNPDPRRMQSEKPQSAICGSAFHHLTIVPKDLQPQSHDRFVVNKLVHPRRWDIIAFRVPSDPSVKYVKRVVGLPGEEVVIRDGAVWINGKQQTPPESLKGLRYAPIAYSPPNWSGSEARPAKLGPDEYFVLGDFSTCSVDSRYWHEGATGHPPYAVPADHIDGVVTHIYWPVKRMRILR